MKNNTNKILEDLIADYHEIVFENMNINTDNPFKSQENWKDWIEATEKLIKIYAKKLNK